MKISFVKKALLFLIALGGLTLFTGCSKTIEPVFEDNKSMHIGAWVSPPIDKDAEGNYKFITKEQYQRIADSGINVIYALYEAADPAATLQALDMAEAVGIGYYVYDWNMRGLFSNVFDSKGQPILEEIESDFELMKKFVAPYKDHPAFRGNLIFDEPGANQFKRLGIYKEKYESYMPDKDFYVNLFPTYASLDQRDGRTYEQYIEEYLTVVKPEFLSYDHYPLMLFYGQSQLTDDYLMNLEIVAQKTKQNNIPFWLFIQTISYSNASGTQTRRPTESDLRWQMAVSMAFGAQGLQHFCYWTPSSGGIESFTDGMIDQNGNISELYYAAQNTNKEVLSFDHVYLSFDWQGVLTHSVDEDNVHVNFRMLDYALKSHNRIKQVTSTQDLLIGTFKDENNNDAFMIVNYNDPALKLENEFEITFNKAKQAIVYIKGVKQVVKLDKGKLKMNLESGEGVFVIPF